MKYARRCIPKIDVYLLFTVAGWLGIALYLFYHPLSFSLVGAIYCLLIYIGGAFIGMYVVPKLFCGPNYSNGADLAARGSFLRAVKRTLKRKFPGLKPLFYERYDCTKIRLDSDLKTLKNRYQRQAQNDTLGHFLRSDPQIKYRWRYRRYRDPKIQDFVTRGRTLIRKEAGWKQSFRTAAVFFLIKIPAEDGFFLTPLCFIGVNLPAAGICALAFGFSHVHYSVINCLRIAASSLLVIFLILPNYGLITCIVGHVLYDLVILMSLIVPGLIPAIKVRLPFVP